jgi:hypothetical protein
MCSMTGCDTEGDMAPKLVFILKDEYETWSMPAILGIQVCAACRPKVKADELLQDKRIIPAILAMRPGSDHAGTRLEWVKLTDPDYIRLQQMRSS